MSPMNIASHLNERASSHPDQTALLLPAAGESAGLRVTYRQLALLSDRLARRLLTQGIGRGVRTVLMVPPSLEFFALTFALFKAGAVSVFVDPGMGIRNIGKCLAEAQPEAFVGIPKAHLARLALGWARPSLKHQIAVGRGSRWCRCLGRQVVAWDVRSELSDLDSGADLRCDESSPAKTQAADTAAILFTSGSTGVPKGAVYTHGNFAAQVDMLRRALSIQPGEIDLCTFPLFALFAPALGMSAVVPRMDFTRPGAVHPPEIAGPVAKQAVANLFGSPALLNRVGRHYEGTDIKWPSLRRVLSAGAPVSPAIIERFARHLEPGVQIYTPYGATEALPVAVIGSDEILGETQHLTAGGAGTCVGRPVDGLRVAVIRISDDAIPEWDDSLLLPGGDIGEIVVDGLNVTQEYFRRPDLTALAKIADPATGRRWHRMGDVGYLDDRGRLWFCGRKSHRVVTAERTLFTEPVEGIFNTHPDVFRTALVGVRRGGRVEPVLCVEREPGRRNPALKQELLELGAGFELTRSIHEILFHPAFPVDIRHNSKIFREKLAVWAERVPKKGQGRGQPES